MLGVRQGHAEGPGALSLSLVVTDSIIPYNVSKKKTTLLC